MTEVSVETCFFKLKSVAILKLFACMLLSGPFNNNNNNNNNNNTNNNNHKNYNFLACD